MDPDMINLEYVPTIGMELEALFTFHETLLQKHLVSSLRTSRVPSPTSGSQNNGSPQDHEPVIVNPL